MSLSRFAGLYRALDFAYGCFGSGDPAPLQIGTGTYASGTASPILALGFTTLADGTILEPLNTNAPVQVGSGPNVETVTPSAVSDLTPTVYNVNSFTADFANAHGTGDLVASGTLGLQEALNAAAAAGGGIVIVDAAWFNAGGTAAIIDAAAAPSGTSIWNTSEGGGYDALIPIAASGAVDPHVSARYVITKAGIAALTLAAPTVGIDDGLTIVITSGTAYAHTLTATGLLNTGSVDVNEATFAAYAGAGLTLIAYDGKWNVQSSIGITFS